MFAATLPEVPVTTAPPVDSDHHVRTPRRGKPMLRGVSHLLALVAWTGIAPWVVAAASPGWPRTATTVYVVAIAALFGVSALYHVPGWGQQAKRALRRADHATIFLAVAGTYTPVAGLALDGAWATTLLVVVWVGAAAGIALAVAFIDASPRLHAIPYVALGWVAVAALPALWAGLGGVAIAWLAAGGVLYSLGAVVYARRRPDPVPEVFGYHEVFHALVIAAVACHLVLVVGFVLPIS